MSKTANTSAVPEPSLDLDAAKQFLDLLEPDGHFWFRALPEPKGTGLPPRTLQGSFAACVDELCRLSQQGYAIFVQINAAGGTKDADVERVRAYFVDLDGTDPTGLLSPASGADILVESSPGKYHGYWLAGDVPLAEFKPRQQALARRFDGDKSVCNLSRVMRLPGFVHRKGEPFATRIHSIKKGL